MIAAVNIAEIAALVGDPSRANMLAAMFDGRALTAGELAQTAEVSAATASGHLGKLVQGRLVTVAVQGRHRYFRLASAEVARMLEQIAVVAGDVPTAPRATPRVPAHLREARTCYDHMAGRLGVAIADGLTARGAIVLGADAGEVTAAGGALFDRIGLRLAAPPGSRRLLCRPCLDWSERRPHLAGLVGTAILERSLELGWVRQGPERRALTLTPVGRRRFAEDLGATL
jgi:DNA-binding transcriptional ArsR family regulator